MDLLLLQLSTDTGKIVLKYLLACLLTPFKGEGRGDRGGKGDKRGQLSILLQLPLFGSKTERLPKEADERFIR